MSEIKTFEEAFDTESRVGIDLGIVAPTGQNGLYVNSDGAVGLIRSEPSGLEFPLDDVAFFQRLRDIAALGPSPQIYVPRCPRLPPKVSPVVDDLLTAICEQDEQNARFVFSMMASMVCPPPRKSVIIDNISIAGGRLGTVSVEVDSLGRVSGASPPLTVLTVGEVSPPDYGIDLSFLKKRVCRIGSIDIVSSWDGSVSGRDLSIVGAQTTPISLRPLVYHRRPLNGSFITVTFYDFFEIFYDPAFNGLHWVSIKTGANADFDALEFLRQLVFRTLPGVAYNASLADVEDAFLDGFDQAMQDGDLGLSLTGRLRLNWPSALDAARAAAARKKPVVASHVAVATKVPQVSPPDDEKTDPIAYVTAPVPVQKPQAKTAKLVPSPPSAWAMCYGCGLKFQGVLPDLDTVRAAPRLCGGCNV